MKIDYLSELNSEQYEAVTTDGHSRGRNGQDKIFNI